MRRLTTVAVVCFTILPIAGCQMGFYLQIVGAPTEPDFVLSPFENGLFGGSPPAIDNVSVAEVSEGHGHAVWAISRDPRCTVTSRFHYGATPADWTASAKPEPLKPGKTYVVEMSGCGFIGGRAFKILGGKIVSAEGFGDMPIKSVEAMK